MAILPSTTNTSFMFIGSPHYNSFLEVSDFVTRQQTLTVSRRITMDAHAIIQKAKDVALKEFVHKKLNELQINKTYPITAMSTFTTKYGPAVLCDLQDGEDTFSVFLPKRYVEAYKDMDATIASLKPCVLGLTVTKQIVLTNGTITYALDIDYCKH